MNDVQGNYGRSVAKCQNKSFSRLIMKSPAEIFIYLYRRTFRKTTLLLLLDVFAVLVPAIHVGSKLLKVAAHQLVKSFMACSMLNKARLITKAIVAIIPQTMKVALVVPVAARREPTIFVKAEF